ncbi:glycoside hydrolase family 5 protein [Pholiota conissans]|uniref:mannan endo-1,4-beta-mannosidase n=1 Tax=Pholiota conissans TaxID=109636 RepID=A0A9P5ZB56_9AGAR|nr:glycoside hydrolase family 5 protein [Pholiota conissans]
MLPLLVLVVLNALLVSALSPTRTVNKRQSAPPNQFVTTDGGSFIVNGSVLTFVGTNAYWLPTLNSDDDIDFTLGNMSAAGIKVVRTWAFNDVETIPENGTWFQLIANGTTTINDGPNGLQKLDTVIRLAEKHNMFVLLSLTNNWNPRPLFDNMTINASGTPIEARDVTPGTNNTLPRNTLSNDYGGMDMYVREFANNSTMHDEFYTNPTILSHFMNYTATIVSRYANNTSVFSWEVANDPRCNSSLPASTVCNTNTVTHFHDVISQHIKTFDPNHLVSSGNQGFLCADCPKLFPRVVPPPPQASPLANVKRRSAKPMTKKRILAERRAALNKARSYQRRHASPTGGLRIRGRWMATETKRQDAEDQGVGSAFDGSSGVDSEDIINVPNINFGTFQLFPDQDNYGFISDPSLPAFNNTVNAGLDWIRRHAEIGTLFNKPITLTGFGLVTQSNSPAFVPFNTSVAPFGPDPTDTQATQTFGVTDEQRDDAYAQWLKAGFTAGLQGMVQYQWTQANLTTVDGTNISPTVTDTGLSPVVTEPGFSPNDGYSLQGVSDSQAQAVNVIQQAAQSIGPDPNT